MLSADSERSRIVISHSSVFDRLSRMIAAPVLLCLLLSGVPTDAEEHLHGGRYEEGLESIDGSTAELAASALFRSRIYMETGRYVIAREVCDEALRKEPRNADLLARSGEIHLARGDYTAALADADQALELAPEHPAARWCKAEALTEIGKIDEANEEWRWFVRFYNRKQPADAETLVYVAKGSLQYARWNRATSIFHFLINELCPDIAKAAPKDWRADAISGALLVEKYNDAQGLPDLKRALTKNPSAAVVHATLAAAAFDDFDLETAAKHVENALEVNPESVEAWGTKADLAWIEGDLVAARNAVEKGLAVNPHHQGLVGRLAAIELLSSDIATAEFAAILAAIESAEPSKLDRSTKVGRIVFELLQRNPKPGQFLNQLGVSLERRRSYAMAEEAYRCAMAVMPQLSEPQVSLGLLSMRAGDLRKAREILDKAFKADPFNIRVSNMRKVIGLLEGYDTLETDHFVIRFDGKRDQVLAELVAEYLEEAYPELTGEFGFEPPQKTTIELYQSGSGQSGHEWFSARMVGLPWIQTIGASTGLMVALSSPIEYQRYHWARVVRHEFVHVITLQQTDFRIPHWYTEALAVRSEGGNRPEEWDELLRERVPEGKLRSLDELNQAFIRPESPSDWQFAYCQSLLYAQTLDKSFGSAVHGSLLGAYARGLSTGVAIQEALGIPAEQFDGQYRVELSRIVAELGPSTDDTPISDEAKAALSSAASAIRRKEFDRAIAELEAVANENEPNPDVLELLGKLKLTTGDAAAAEQIFAAGQRRFPHDLSWLKLRVAALLKGEGTDELRPLLEELADRDPDDSLAATKLAELAREAKDWSAVREWAMQALYAAPREAKLHDLLAEACDALGQAERAGQARRHAKLLRDGTKSVDELKK